MISDCVSLAKDVGYITMINQNAREYHFFKEISTHKHTRVAEYHYAQHNKNLMSSEPCYSLRS